MGPPVEENAANAPEQVPAFPEQTRAPSMISNVSFEVETIAEGLVDLWGMAFLPDGRLLVTERDGRMRIVDGANLSPAIEGVPEITRQEISGLADVVLDPDFARNHRIFWSYVEGRPEGNMLTVARGTLIDGAAPRLDDVEVIYRQEPSLPSEHGNFGARMLFDDSGALFVTLGDLASTPLRPYIQQLDTGIGKIVRITTDGKPAPGNPYAGQEGALPELWAAGFRNPLGLAFRPGTEQLWEVDVGPRGGDELNLIEPGANYGWPVNSYGLEYSGELVGDGPVSGGEDAGGYLQPVYYWDPVISPSSLAFYTGDLFPEWRGDAFVTSLSQMHLVRLKLEGDRVVGEERLLVDQEERLRLVKQAPDGSLYVLTDGVEGKILRIVPAKK
ncbi:PQQ-dependent sugar dehydrogenase [Alteraurantiacibacter aestuarii]|nr:PQQ-dependent sugar dehydrogenase [Alteraurantiacibacter aestuarii]